MFLQSMIAINILLNLIFKYALMQMLLNRINLLQISLQLTCRCPSFNKSKYAEVHLVKQVLSIFLNSLKLAETFSKNFVKKF